MKANFIKTGILLLFGLFLNTTNLLAQTNKILNNDRLRIGNGSQNSINSAGNMEQPFYYNGTTYRKLTYSAYPLDIQWGIGGDGTNNWNINGSLVQNPALGSQTFDYSNFTVTNPTTGDGYGQIRTSGTILINGQAFVVESTYELLQPEGYIGIKVKITNISGSPASNVRLWVGTRDDFVGGSDGPTKTRGNLIDEEFVAISAMTEQAKAIKISTSQEAILFFSNSDRAYSTINNCCSFSNATNQNPETNVITQTGDGSYALYVRFNDLGVNESDELIWYYGAGTLPEIDEIIARVASAAIGAFDNITYNSADYAATTVEPGTGYWILVPDGANAPTEAQIKAGADYDGVTLISSGNAAMQADVEHIFNLTGLSAYTDYDFYFVSEYFDGVDDVFTETISEDLHTKEAPPVLDSFTPETAAYGETVTISGSNLLTTSGVTIGGQNATYTVIDSGTVEIIVPNGADDFYVELTNESGTSYIESEISETTGNCITGWSGAWQTLTPTENGILNTVTLKLDNTDLNNDYDLFLELHETDNDPASASPGVKFNSLLGTSETITMSANTPASEVQFTFSSNLELVGNVSYYIVLKEAPGNPSGTGLQGVYKQCSSSGTTDGGAGNVFGRLYYKFTVNPILNVSNPPTDISISQASIQENNTVNQVVGSFSTTDADVGDTHSYAFVSGSGDTDNASFVINGSDLESGEIFDYETKTSYAIRISTTDSEGNSFEKSFTISIQDDTDEDGDGINDSSDNCLNVANADQTDTDSDGMGNVCDEDDDNDGTPDTEDAFPLDNSEDTDTDGDGTGDNADTDDDNDGTPDTEDAFPLDGNEDTDTDGDGTGDNADTDDDNDGTPDTEDAFPLDGNEDTDTDGDGTGDNADTDDDNDGTPDTEDAFPLDGNEDTDTDGDGTGDNADTDDDNDGTPDTEDAFPLDGNEDTDTDGDGTGDNADNDDDNDGTPDTEDAFPLDGNEDTDTDGDGTGDNADTDDDNDGTPDTEDAFPLDGNEDTDTDGDGTGDNADTDDDNDGTPDTEDAFPLDGNEDTDTDGDGTGDNADNDDDNDGTPDTEDAFPLDGNEDTDTDGDGTGDNADNDDDNDGTPDTEDAFPLDGNEDTDTDGDGNGDNADDDDDNDGTPDAEDAFPLDGNEDTDTDGDGSGDNADTDDDNDGTPDTEDAFPLDGNEDTDTDGDGNGDNADDDIDGDGIPNNEDLYPYGESEDRDNDGVPDVDDAFPDDSNESIDSDGDGTGDNADTDDDNDGVMDDEDVFPWNPNEHLDSDNDGIGNNTDADDDNDGINDASDKFPLDPSEDSDIDSDGIGDNADLDDDGDGISDSVDAFPTNKEPTLVPAQAFTPNGDGNNDAWVIPGIDNYPNNVVKVYNRWGHEVFAMQSYNNDWEGFYKENREKLPSGSYLYVIDLGDGSEVIRGWIFINY
ncbi:thrombospondin type 3 repeat-containing protein [Pareuzebyella sediminis]|uniref:thrombospondin type 3 repeat-containing protein n=1 Tax=Pareuzebyella sediminis TaxID=2607998 RepID=UPI0011EF1BAB|nr:thrombospondin type 3 repeat-containing protein [Pareuzebyella sediminis]